MFYKEGEALVFSDPLALPSHIIHTDTLKRLGNSAFMLLWSHKYGFLLDKLLSLLRLPYFSVVLIMLFPHFLNVPIPNSSHKFLWTFSAIFYMAQCNKIQVPSAMTGHPTPAHVSQGRPPQGGICSRPRPPWLPPSWTALALLVSSGWTTVLNHHLRRGHGEGSICSSTGLKSENTLILLSHWLPPMSTDF